MLIELGATPTAALPIAEFGDHLRMGSGFTDDGSQNPILEAYLRASMAAIESRIGKALFQRSYSWQVTQWRDSTTQALPIAPVQAVTALSVTDRAGAATLQDTDSYWLQQDSQRPRLMARSGKLAFIPDGGHADIFFDAGYGLTWADIPVDLAQAVFLLAAHYYENRLGQGPDAVHMPFGVMALIETHRTVRLLGGHA